MPFTTDPDRSDVLDTGYIGKAVTVSTSAVEARVGAERLVARQAVFLFNDGDEDVFFGPSSVAVSGTNKGMRLFPSQHIFVPVGQQELYLISASTGCDVIVQELS